MTAARWVTFCGEELPARFNDRILGIDQRFGAAGRTVDQYRAKPLQREVVQPIRELEQESQNGNSG